jgi:putative ABC transport system substrate-binding protein
MLTGSLPAGAQPAERVHRVGFLGDKAADSNEVLMLQTLRTGLRERGWIEGENIRFEARWVEGNFGRLSELAADLVRVKPDVIVTRGSLFTGALKAATSSIPIVFLGHAGPVESGHVASLAAPGGNITGSSVLQTELAPKVLELLHATVPAATRIAVLWHSDSPSVIPGLKTLEEPARRLGLQLQPIGARTAKELEAAFSTMVQRRAQAVLVFSTPPFVTERQRIADLAIAHRLPTMMQGSQFVEAGCLMSYGHNYVDTWRRGTVYVDKVLRGANPATLPVEQVKELELVINLKTAKALGLTIPAEVLGRADRVIR